MLLVDDEIELVEVVADALRMSGFEVDAISSSIDALARVKPGAYDVLITDMNMPGLHGVDLQRQCLEIDPTLAVIVVTAGSDVRQAVECLKSGAHDFIVKPFDLDDLAIRISKALESRRLGMIARDLERENEVYRLQLEARVAQQSEQLRSMFERALQSLAHALEAKDVHTRNHSERVAAVALALAREVAPEPRSFQQAVVTAALLHDIGKIGIPESILRKPSGLTPEDFAFVKRHPEIGESILQPIYASSIILSAVRHHHEAYDGSGYPDGLEGEEIPLAARIIAVADSYDAMTSARPYRSAIPRKRAIEILEEGAGTQWDAEVVLTLVDIAADGRLDAALATVQEAG